MLPLLILWLNLTLGDACNLGSDRWQVREAATQRLGAYRELTWPALLLARQSRDLERKRRAERLLVPLRASLDQSLYDALALWLFYGPDQVDLDDPARCRFLRMRCLLWVNGFTRATRNAIQKRANDWGLGRGAIYDHFGGYINVMRFRAYGLPDPR